ncbi:putative enzyme related to lactoylglutathione lyase [Paenibacillus rhizosphaerae]|uniref:Putative enzyme related to lactoylglutathione lyase n=1 Tax=Paenibacillus rhizosphaerae TaxID=297318 RepID=A0A839TM05_9BACL|nr:VOC family protein [Paenibacillus rhizosphaerae]MBB3127836.1 putative enzyme related to lactoylglutathione lyase [Paenibacillus rhizosphaerae]
MSQYEEMIRKTANPLENRIASVFVHVTNLRESAEWYSRLLGLPIREDRLNGGPVYWFDFQGTHLILDSNSVNRQNPDWNQDMMPRMMFPAMDIDEAYLLIREQGTPLFEPERHGPMAYFNFRDPEGNVQMACWTQNREEDPSLAGLSRSPISPRIGGVFVDVKHMPAAAKWYSGLLGAEYDEAAAEQRIYSVPTASGAALLLDQNRHLNGESFSELFFFETEDFDGALQFVRSYGFELAGEPQIFPDLSEFALLDPDGNRIVIAQMNEGGQ